MKADALLQKAAEVVSGDRAKAHGSMEETHQLIADFWQLYLDNRREKNKPLTSQDVAMMMVLLKCARSQRGRLEVDDYLDMAGYIGCAAQMVFGKPIVPTVTLPGAKT
jgi:hypothetical protein